MKRQVFLVGATLLVLTGCNRWRERNNDAEPTVSNPTTYDRGTYNQNYTQGAGQNAQNNLRAMDADFLLEAASGNQKEVQLGQLAVRQAENEKVRDFGQRMVADHTRMLDETKELARTKGVSLSDRLQPSAQTDVTRFGNLKGADFDREYIRAMIADHEKDADAFDREARTGDDASVRSLAARALPTIREHLRMARDIDQNMTAPMLGQPKYNAPPTNVPRDNMQDNPNSPGNPRNPANPTSPDSTNPANPTSPNNPDNPTNDPNNPTNPTNPR